MATKGSIPDLNYVHPGRLNGGGGFEVRGERKKREKESGLERERERE